MSEPSLPIKGDPRSRLMAEITAVNKTTPWTEHEDRRLRDYVSRAVGSFDPLPLGLELNRTGSNIRRRMDELGLSVPTRKRPCACCGNVFELTSKRRLLCLWCYKSDSPAAEW